VSTPSERILRCFRDVSEAADLIRAWVEEAGDARRAIFNDLKARSAIERQFLIISEAATRLYKIDPTIAPTLAPSVDWAGIRGIGNFIRHKYDDLDKTILIEVIENRLDGLRLASVQAGEALEASSPPRA